MDTTFHNVTITIDAEAPRAAYDMLCNALGTIELCGIGIEWNTDTYSTESEQAQRPTTDLFPNTEQ